MAKNNKAIYNMRHTKIVVTIGPVTSTPMMITKLIQNGVNVFRLNFSHGDYDTHKNSALMIRKASKELDKEVAILQDISGPKVRIGEIDGVLELNSGDILKLVKVKNDDEKTTLNLSYPQIIDMVNIDEEVFFADGTIRSLVVDKDDNSLTLKLLNSGELTSKKGVNFPKTKIDISSITPKDKEDLIFGAKIGVDIVALSFVQSIEDIFEAKQVLKDTNFNPFIISKIETSKAIENLDEILKESDGVMVARGDLGAEFGVTKLPRIQKTIIKKANESGIPVITATQMLTTMKDHPFPTRAEVSDIANAVYDGTDAVMLSDETTVGNYPLEAVTVLHDTIIDVEQDYKYNNSHEPKNSSQAIAKSAVTLSKFLNQEAIVTFTSSGYSARAISMYKPSMPIYAISHCIKTHRLLNLVWGVKPLFTLKNPNNPTELMNNFVKKANKIGFINEDSEFVLTMGSSTGKSGSTNLIRVLKRDAIEQILG